MHRVIVFIYLPGETVAVPAGRLTHDVVDGEAVGSFEYGRGYLERAGALPVDPVALPLGVAPMPVHTNGGLYGAFRDAAPDYWGRLVIASRLGVPAETLTDIDYLLASNASRVGNLDFRETPESPEPKLSPPSYALLPDLIDAADRLERGDPAPMDVAELMDPGSSLGGARPKCTVEHEDALWIAKFPSRYDTHSVPRKEFGALELAQRAGIQAPERRLEQIGSNDVLLVRRFDRQSVDSGWSRTGFVSALSLMQIDERQRDRWSYLTVAAHMRRHCRAGDLEELFRRMVFNIMIRNNDDHPRNHGFLARGHELALSPVYDLEPRVTRVGVGTEFDLAMTVGPKGRAATIGNALAGAAQFGLSQGVAADIVEQARDAVSGWHAVYSDIGFGRHDLDMLAPTFG